MSKLATNLGIAGIILLSLDNLVEAPTMARRTTMARTTRLARMAGLGPISTDILTRQDTLQVSLPVSRFFKKKMISRTDIRECRARDGV